MALFFDSAWFDAKLSASGLSRGDLATALGLTAREIDELWKDQRELKASDVRLIAALLGATPAEVASHAGVSTPVPKEADAAGLERLERRLDRIEQSLAELKTLIGSLKAGR
jgi:transcriptional regulator with XRE-family HTH domain